MGPPALPRWSDDRAAAAAGIGEGLTAEGLLAQVVTAKFADHQPPHRQQRIFARSGVDVPVSTMCGWVAAVADALPPIVDHLRQRLRASSYLQTDDTPITVLADDGESFTGRITGATNLQFGFKVLADRLDSPVQAVGGGFRVGGALCISTKWRY